MTVAEFRQNHAKLLKNSTTAHLDTDCILCHFIGKNRTWLLSKGSLELNSIMNEDQICMFEKAFSKRISGLPVAYITNQKEFYGINFYVDKNVLIPKPDTEILVEKAIQLIDENGLKKVADVCTGSGCISIAVASNVKSDLKQYLEFHLTDVSHTALEVAEKNCKQILGGKESKNENGNRTKIGNFNFYLCEIMDGIPYNDFDIILANPPYVPRIIVNQLLKDGRSEPILALDGDACYIDTREANYGDGMSIIRPLVAQSFRKLKKGGFFLCETGEYNNELTKNCCLEVGFSYVQTINDLENSPRLVFAEKI
ncbi:MAG: HemK/PrmC family methyltransferase [Treponemataceae bacterium]